MNAAHVYLVGAGPGDSGLITMRGFELLRRADAVVYDYLVPGELLAEIPDSAELVYVGKKGFSAHITQDEINELLVRTACEVAARGGNCVVRLKGGDPFVFGRGGEEALALREAGITYEIIPGVTSGIAAPAYAGIPVTHRGVASHVTFVTGHETPEKNASAIDWRSLAHLAQAGGTLCFYMGMRNLELITQRLQDEGLSGEFPAAIVQRGTSASQRTLVATLATLVEDVRAREFGAPAIILVGEVATLREELAWVEERALFGRRLVVTRSRAQASEFASELRELGADVMEFPTIAFCEPDDLGPLDDALGGLDAYDWLVFTSVNGVDAFFTRLDGDARALAGVRVAAIGPATAARLERNGIRADAVPGEYRGEAVFEEIYRLTQNDGDCAGTLEGMRILIVRAQVARDALPNLLRESGAHVDVVAGYKTVVPEHAKAAELVRQLENGDIDGVTFTSSSTVRNLVSLLGDDASALRSATLYSIGPITSATLREEGFENIVEAGEYTVPGVVSAIMEDCS